MGVAGRRRLLQKAEGAKAGSQNAQRNSPTPHHGRHRINREAEAGSRLGGLRSDRYGVEVAG